MIRLNDKETISLKEAAREVELASKRIGLLHLAFAETLTEELGEEEGKRVILRAIKNYGQKIGNRVREKLVEREMELDPENFGSGDSRSLPEFGMHEKIEEVEVDGEPRIRAYGCVMAQVWKEYCQEELGKLYCYVDPAKYMAFNPKCKLVHTKALPAGDEYCEFAIRETTEEERQDFSEKEKDWSYIDKTL